MLRFRHIRSLTLLLTLALLLAGCAGLPRQASAPTPVPPAPAWSAELQALHDERLRVAGVETRRFDADHWWTLADPLLAPARGFRVQTIGQSVEGRPLRHVAWGEGPIQVLAWSQMHGDESTGSMALLDLFRLLGEHPEHPLVAQLRQRTQLHFLPMMNPDGAARFERRNANGVDLNRDAHDLSQPESRALKALFDQIRPDFGFNLHDQRPGYRAGDSERQVAIALLSPPYDRSRRINAVRTRAIGVAAAIRAMLEPHIAGHIARWDDSFNPRAFGDLTTRWGSSTVLIEAGGIDGDPQKQAVRRLYFLALVAGLDAIASGSHAQMPAAIYHELPENGEVWPDLLLRGGTVMAPGNAAPVQADVLVNFRDPLAGTGGIIRRVGDLARVRARSEVDISGLFLHPAPCPDSVPQPAPAGTIVADAPACLRLSRDRAGTDVIWQLLGDIDPARPRPPTL
ncbi:MAG: M14 family zinc carboxypeptidase [Pseudoxanthomonas suwonensis]|nr:M14 family zinc carboxypeptidase [Pseudoxanthomonas suwonensis]